MKKDKILSIAIHIRKWLENEAKNGNHYSDVCPKTLECGCGIASSRLLLELQKAKVENAKIVCCEYHAYIMVDDHILDITASQFDQYSKTPVLFMPWREFIEKTKYSFLWTDKPKEFNCPFKFRSNQIRTSWPEDQIIELKHLPAVPAGVEPAYDRLRPKRMR